MSLKSYQLEILFNVHVDVTLNLQRLKLIGTLEYICSKSGNGVNDNEIISVHTYIYAQRFSASIERSAKIVQNKKNTINYMHLPKDNGKPRNKMMLAMIRKIP